MVHFADDVARHFFVQNILFLAREYHIDAFRFDFTRPIHNQDDGNIRLRGSGGGWAFLCEMRRQVKAVDPGILLIAEELPNDWGVTVDRADFGCAPDGHGPFDSQWSDSFHDRFADVLAGGNIGQLSDAFTSYGDSWQDGLIYSESHDEVGNVDGRIARRARDGKGWEMDQIAGAGTLLARGIPMLFIGQESGEDLQFGQDDDRGTHAQPPPGGTTGCRSPPMRRIRDAAKSGSGGGGCSTSVAVISVGSPRATSQ
jgi:1,4-alpha-glucan branching enzyme